MTEPWKNFTKPEIRIPLDVDREDCNILMRGLDLILSKDSPDEETLTRMLHLKRELFTIYHSITKFKENRT